MKNIKTLCALAIVLGTNIGFAAKLPGHLNYIQNKTLEITKDYYAGAKQTAIADTDFLADFTGHTQEHILMVADKTLRIINAFETAIDCRTMQKEGTIEKNNADVNRYNFKNGIDRKTVVAAAIFHDSGMNKGGLVINKDNQVSMGENGKAVKATNGNDIRKNHALNSAVNVLANRDELEALGINVDLACLLCFAHSKSSSGVRDISSRIDWQNGFDKLDKVIDVYNNEHDVKIFFNRKSFEINEDLMGELLTGTLAIRLGDVSRDSGKHAKAQNGGEIVVYRSTVNSFAKEASEEAEKALVYNYALGPVKSCYSRQIHVGEQNNIMNNTVAESDGTLFHDMTLADGNYAPHSTFQNVIEHAGELESAPDASIKMRILFENEVEDRFKAVYNTMRQEYKDQKQDKAIEIIYPWD